MVKIDIINNFIKMLTINIYMYFIFIKILDYKENNWFNVIIIFFLSSIMAAIHVISMQYINPVLIMPITYCVYSIFIKIIIKEKFNYCFLLTNLSFVITYIIYLIAVYLSGFMLLLVFNKIKYNNPVGIVIMIGIMAILYGIFNNIKRFKNGVNFLKNKENVKQKEKIINTISIITLFILGLLNNYNNIVRNYLLVWISMAFIIYTLYWIRSQITKYYKKNMKDRTIEVQKLEIEENKKEIKDIKEENLKLAEVVHRYNNRLSAIEMALEETINKNTNLEFSNELSIILKETKEISKNFAKESEIAKNTLPTTNIPGIDNMFKYMQNEAINNNIKFDLKLTDSIHDLIDNIISKDKFETMLGDHLRDAIIAVNNSKNSYKSILVTLGIVENCYELSIYDTGIEFEVNTLLKLGKERITTHKETGGSGIGFMTTFDTLRKTKGSLIIEEYDSNNSSYTKSINIRFDGKSEYRIYSYRADEIKRQNKDKNIIVKEI